MFSTEPADNTRAAASGAAPALRAVCRDGKNVRQLLKTPSIPSSAAGGQAMVWSSAAVGYAIETEPGPRRSIMTMQEGPTGGDKAATATTEAPPKRKTRPAPPKQDKLPPFNVVLHNDEVNSMEQVIEAIVAITPLTLEVAVRKMLEAHTRKRSLLLTTHKERAELYRDQFKSKKLKVTIEPAAG
jgi:ATP-dependent Clp protease adaptor protein ClpS